jgi:cysteine desulfurase/selenocysteine lyase
MVKSASEALGLTASAFLWKPGDNVVICADVEHGNNVYPWLNLKERYGIEVRTVPARESHIPVEAMIKAIDARTRVLTASTVTTSPGFRVDAAALGKACRERGVFYLLDGAQTAGIMHTDVKAMYADAFACSTVKGLMGLYGMGFLYMRKEWAERLTPPYIARFSVDLGDLPEAAMTGLNYRLRDGAKRFDAGHYNFPGAIAVYNSLGELGSVGTQAIEAHVVGLARRLAQGLLDLGIPVAGGAPGPHTASIVSVGISKPGFFSEASAPAFAELADQLTKNNVIFSIRRGLIRFSLHLYNTEAEIDRVIEIAKAWKSKARRA